MNRNEVRVEGEVVFVMLTDRKGIPQAEAIINTADLDRVLEVGRWSLLNGYVGQKVAAGVSRTTRYLHRFLLNAQAGMVVDHANHNRLDNRRNNLRFLTHAHNPENRRGARRGSSTGVHNVSSIRTEGLYKVALGRKTIGRFTDLADAGRVAKDARAAILSYATT